MRLGSESSDLDFRYLLIYQNLKTLIFVPINIQKYGQRNYVRDTTFGTTLKVFQWAMWGHILTYHNSSSDELWHKIMSKVVSLA